MHGFDFGSPSNRKHPEGAFRRRLARLLLAGLLLAGPLFAGPADKGAEAQTAADRAKLTREAEALNIRAVQVYREGKYAVAFGMLDQALKMNERLYPAGRYPAGHPELAQSLNNLGVILKAMGEYRKALPYFEQALAMNNKLYPASRYPDGHIPIARTLSNLGLMHKVMGEHGKALPYYEKALAMAQKLYPAARYPDGHPGLATDLNNLGALFLARGEYGKALPYYEQALAMRQKLYPAARYPNGHPELAISLNNLGFLLQTLREYDKALPYLDRALLLRQKLYPAARYPQGHPDLALSLLNLGGLLDTTGEYAKALPYYERALAMFQRLYPATRYPNGHPELAISLNTLGSLHWSLGEYDRALPYLKQSLAMRQKLYPAARFPDGHPELAGGLSNLGLLLHAREEYGKALPYLEQGLAMYQNQFRSFADQASEAEGLVFAGSLLHNRDALLSVAVHLPGTEAAAYRQVWQTKAALTRVLSRRHLAALAQGEGSATKQRWQELADARRHLARLLAAPIRDVAARDREVRELTDRKEKLERDLAASLPALARQQKLDPLGPESLANHLPAQTAFVDLLRYTRYEYDPKVRGAQGERRTRHYVAFLLVAGQPVQRLELGPAQPIEKALLQWRAALAQGKDSRAGQELGKLLWQPIAGHLPRKTQRLNLSPDEDLAGLPWAALPIGQGEVLLERYTLAVVPHGPFLLDQLLHPAQPPRDPGRLLALGGVQYGRGYPALPGTRLELESIVARAGQRPLVRLEGTGASAARLVQELPRVRYAHLATHGFFNEVTYQQERDRQARQWQTWQFDQNHTTERIGQGARNPLGFTGLVLAGEGPGAIVTGESLVELPLEGLYLAVLSACETGLGARVVGGEVHGLQRAFHLAGCRNVVVSLWQVPDVPTLVLMEEFYQRLWDEKKPLPPAEALRQAQLEVLRHPEKVTRRARKMKAELVKRGASGEELRGIQKVLAPLPEGGKVEDLKRSPPLWWAGFVLSGDGQ